MSRLFRGKMWVTEEALRIGYTREDEYFMRIRYFSKSNVDSGNKVGVNVQIGCTSFTEQQWREIANLVETIKPGIVRRISSIRSSEVAGSVSILSSTTG